MSGSRRICVIASRVSRAILVLAWSVGFFYGAARAGTENQTGATLSITSNPSGMKVFAGGLLLGETPLDSARVESGLVEIRLGDARIWNGESAADTLSIAPGEHASRHFEIPLVVRVTSDPFGAAVMMDDSVLGVTPAYLVLERRSAQLKLSRQDYADATASVGPDIRTIHVPLTPVGPGAGAGAGASGPSEHGSLGVYVAAGAAVAAGAFSAYLKHQADSRYTEYQRTGDRATLEKVKTLDLLSGLALATSEVALGLMIYQLLSR